MNASGQLMELLKQNIDINSKITCGRCNRKHKISRMFRCYEGLIWFCNECASIHFNMKRPNIFERRDK